MPHPFLALSGFALFQPVLCHCRENRLNVVRQYVVAAFHQRPGFGRSYQPESGTGRKAINQAWHPAALGQKSLNVIQ